MKTREIQQIITARGYERGVVHVLETLNEKITQNQRDMKELSLMFLQMTQSLDGMMAVAGNMKATIQRMNGEQAEPELGDNTHALDRKDN